jgi:hypothetical protein
LKFIEGAHEKMKGSEEFLLPGVTQQVQATTTEKKQIWNSGLQVDSFNLYKSF